MLFIIYYIYKLLDELFRKISYFFETLKCLDSKNANTLRVIYLIENLCPGCWMSACHFIMII
jgi:hypothetical protein